MPSKITREYDNHVRVLDSYWEYLKYVVRVNIPNIYFPYTYTSLLFDFSFKNILNI